MKLVLDRYREASRSILAFCLPGAMAMPRCSRFVDWMVHYAQAVQIETLAAQVHRVNASLNVDSKRQPESPLEYLQKIRIEQARDRLEFSREVG